MRLFCAPISISISDLENRRRAQSLTSFQLNNLRESYMYSEGHSTICIDAGKFRRRYGGDRRHRLRCSSQRLVDQLVIEFHLRTLERFCILTYVMRSLPASKVTYTTFWLVEPSLGNRPLVNLFANNARSILRIPGADIGCILRIRTQWTRAVRKGSARCKDPLGKLILLYPLLKFRKGVKLVCNGLHGAFYAKNFIRLRSRPPRQHRQEGQGRRRLELLPCCCRDEWKTEGQGKCSRLGLGPSGRQLLPAMAGGQISNPPAFSGESRRSRYGPSQAPGTESAKKAGVPLAEPGEETPASPTVDEAVAAYAYPSSRQ